MSATPERMADTGRAGRIAAWIQSLDSEERAEREAARLAIISAGTAAVPSLIRCLGDSRTRVRWEAAKALVDLPDLAAAAALVARLEDEDGGVRWLAAEALAAIGKEALPVLLAALEEPSHSHWLRAGAHHVIRRLPSWRLVEVLLPVVDALEHTGAESTVPVAAETALDSLRREEL